MKTTKKRWRRRAKPGKDYEQASHWPPNDEWTGKRQRNVFSQCRVTARVTKNGASFSSLLNPNRRDVPCSIALRTPGRVPSVKSIKLDATETIIGGLYARKGWGYNATDGVGAKSCTFFAFCLAGATLELETDN